MPSKSRTYSRLSEEALALLGKQIRLARKGRRMSEKDLSGRTGCSDSRVSQRLRPDVPETVVGMPDQNLETEVSFAVMNSRRAGWPSRVARIPRSMAGTISPGSVTRSPKAPNARAIAA